jgi:hypothetical protein
VAATIVLWNLAYLERVADALRGHGLLSHDALPQYPSPLGWEHINLTGDCLWCRGSRVRSGKFRPLRSLARA